MTKLPAAWALASAAALAFPAVPMAEEAPSLSEVQTRTPEEEVIYFVMPDRFQNGDKANDTGGLGKDPLKSGYDPAKRGFYHGGDLKGLTAKLDYIQGMGATAIWFTPIFKNKAVQGPKGDESAAYHGYWITDFTSVDPHLGTNAEFKAFVDAAHARGMKVYMDIITNHTADVIQYKEGDGYKLPYRDTGAFPYSRRGGVAGNSGGAPINNGFLGDSVKTEENFAKLTDPTYAYTPIVPKAEKNAKTPAWLNDPIYYHNRGGTNWEGESAQYGDFIVLDDLYTEHPRVVAGMIEIYRDWIKRFKVDGFRIDTARHVNPEFWQAFVPAIMETARQEGIPNFHIFGEVASQMPDPLDTALWTHIGGLPANLDMAFSAATIDVAAGKAPPALLARVLGADPLYNGGAKAALRLPTFLGNHDFGRLGMFIKRANEKASEDELLARVKLAKAMLFGLRGVPVVYYGDEQGFVSDGHDQMAREDMFPSQVAEYNDNNLIGTDATTADDNFDTSHPLYQHIAGMAKARKSSKALTYGLNKIRVFDHQGPGLLAVTRHDEASGERALVAYNSSAAPITRSVAVDYDVTGIETLAGACPAEVAAPGSITITLPAFGYAICALYAKD